MKRPLHSFLVAVFIAGVFSGLCSCDSLLYEEEGDCSVRYHVPFKFTRNILEADAFASQVTEVNLFVFDKNGTPVLSRTDSGERLANPGYTMDVSLPPGRYDMIAWCSGVSPAYDPVAFEIGKGDSPETLTATLPLASEDGRYSIDRDIIPLFYGRVEDVVCEEDDYGDISLPEIDLTRDTHGIDVLLVNREGREMKTSDFTISVEADNPELDCLNNPKGFKKFSHHPWSFTPVKAETKSDLIGQRSDVATSLFAETTVGRLTTDRKPRLVITRNSDGEKVVNLDLVSTLVLVKGHYNSRWQDQEYLDRMDRFQLMFVLSDDLSWYTALGININGWTVVPPQDTPL